LSGIDLTVGDSAEHSWLMEAINRAFSDSGGRIAADMQLLMHMCFAEPKSAQYAMQFLAQEVQQRLGGKPVVQADASTGSFVTYLGAIAFAYGGVFVDAEGVGSLEWLTGMYPVIADCMNAMSPVGD